ncbi:MAG: transglutaminase-like domain-containing protein [Bacteroidia bacterium]|nr:transglutaminase-like domain-containing protein [Bacteroidia bacterium]MDW8345975.1 transglutaminase-like domain-containing protein [Bacteroidia bacterium]
MLSEKETKEIQTLLYLLEDTSIAEEIEKHLLERKDLLKRYVAYTPDALQNAYLQGILDKLIREEVFTSFAQWIEKGCKDIFEGAMWVTLYMNPHIDTKFYFDCIQKWYQKALTNLPVYPTPIDIVRSINLVLFKKEGFHGATENYQHPDNSYIHRVIDLRKGIPLSLSIIYLSIVHRMRVPIFGVNLPAHFIMMYRDANEEFYINAFNQGVIFHKSEIDAFIQNAQLTPKPEYYNPCANIDIIKRMLVNLRNGYISMNNIEKLNKLETFARKFFPEYFISPPSDENPEEE